MNTSVNYQPRNPDGFACFHKACIVQSETRCVLNLFFFPFGFPPVKKKKTNKQRMQKTVEGSSSEHFVFVLSNPEI